MYQASSRTLSALSQRRRRAVELRISGCSLPKIRTETSLSASAIIAAYKAFLTVELKTAVHACPIA
jgi:hypothetical protein